MFSADFKRRVRRRGSFLLVSLLQCSFAGSFTRTAELARKNCGWISVPNSAHPFDCLFQYNVSFRRRRSSHLYMGKGDGKKKRKKKASAPATSPPAASTPAPLRVSTDINIPVKRQIKWAKMKQDYIKSQSSFRQTNVKTKVSYRKRLDEEEQQQVIEDKRRRAADVDWDVILSNGNGTSAGALMLVDGYNVIFQYPRYKKQMLKGNTQRARELLVGDLEQLHNIKGWRIECVFDGFGRKTTGALGDGPGGEQISMSDREFKRQDNGRGVRIVYSGVGASADSYIESRCIDAKNITQGKLSVSGGSLIVVSNDAMIRMVASGAGALCMRSEMLVDELKAVKKVTEYQVEVAMAIANGGYVRPEGMRNKRINAPTMQGAKGTGANPAGLSEVNGMQVFNTFKGGQFIIEDKRKRKKEVEDVSKRDSKKRAVLEDMKEGTQDLPSWAILPDAD